MTGFFKANEKVLMVVLLAVLAPTFAFTGLFSSLVGSQQQATPILELGDEMITLGVYEDARESVIRQSKAYQVTQMGGVSRSGATEGQIVDYLIYSREADRLGIECSTAELSAMIEQAGISLAATKVVQDNIKAGETYDTAQAVMMAMFAAKAEVSFNVDDYRKNLRELNKLNKSFGMSIAQFEKALRENIRISKVRAMGSQGTPVTDADVYAEYKLDQQKRFFDYIAVPVAEFEKQVRPSIEKETAKIEEYFNTNKAKFAEPNKVQLEIAKLNPTDIKANLVFTEEELMACYEENKGILYIDTKAGEGDEVVYKSFEDVRGQVDIKLKTERISELAVLALEAGKAAEGDFSLLSLFGENAGNVTIIETTEFSQREWTSLPADYRHFDLNKMFNNFDDLKEGDLCAAPVKMTSGDFIYRIVKKSAASDPKLEAVRDRVIDELAKVEARDKGVETLNGWSKEINEKDDQTLESFAESKGYEIKTTKKSVTKNERAFDGIQGTFSVARSGFEIDEKGKCGAATLSFIDNTIYMLRYKDHEDPTDEGLEAAAAGIRNRLTRERQQTALKEYEAEVKNRYPAKFVEQEKSNDAS